MAHPGPRRVVSLLEPAQPPRPVIGRRIGQVAVARIAAVGAGKEVEPAVAVDVGEDEAHQPVGEEAADLVRAPNLARRRPAGRLLQPDDAPLVVADHDVDQAVAAQVGVVHVEAGDDRFGRDLDPVFLERDRAAGGGDVLEPEDPALHPRAGDHVQVAVFVQIERLRVHRDDDAQHLVLHPGVAVERVVGKGEPRHRVLVRRAGRRVLPALVRGQHLGTSIRIEVAQEDPDVRPAVVRDGRDHAFPALGPARRAGVLEVDEVREFAGNDHVGIAVAVHVADGHVFRRAGLLALGERVEIPDVRVRRPVGDPDMAVRHAVVGDVRFVDGDDVEVAVTVEIRHLQAIAAPDGDAAQREVVDDVLAPGNVRPVGGPGASRGIGDGDRRFDGAGVRAARGARRAGGQESHGREDRGGRRDASQESHSAPPFHRSVSVRALTPADGPSPRHSRESYRPCRPRPPAGHSRPAR